MTDDESAAHAEDVIARAEAIEQRLEDNPTFKSLNSGFRRLSFITYIVIIGVTILAFTVGGLVYTYGRLIRTQETQQERCELNNRNKAGERELWDFLLGLPPRDPSPAQEATRQQLNDIVVRIFAETDCSRPN